MIIVHRELSIDRIGWVSSVIGEATCYTLEALSLAYLLKDILLQFLAPGYFGAHKIVCDNTCLKCHTPNV
jgi:hypothetical protein